MNLYSSIKESLKQNPSTWLITGVAGFIGSNLLEALLKLNQRVIGLDDFSTGTQYNLQEVSRKLPNEFSRKFTLIEGDICSEKDCIQSVEGVDYILHHAAVASVPLSFEFPEQTHAINVTGFLNILNAARKAKVKKIVYASSSAVYGNSSIPKKRETDCINPMSPYAVSKHVNELYAKNFEICYGLPSIGLRYFNIFGPRQNPHGPYAAVIPLWIDAMVNNRHMYINGDGNNIRDFCYIEDVVQANILAALSSSLGDTVYNVGCGEGTTLNELLQMLKMIICPERINLTYRDFRQGDIKISEADISYANTKLGFIPTTTLSEGLKLVIDSCQSIPGTITEKIIAADA
ncbi:NAD-dependent epimerase/dehydratase family protein [Legionella hackeliae]|uniref:Vi polysaccharide biosynthesis protein vipB/tviC n=1 Tax=Legionella hackeliae TaxID=449 RepID=A0A0A8URV0_LEGHA|nr:NAD-dependent epimerase/dehydratase family protein [Legionella hackeliae]KTD08808.1 UDP-glucuronate 5'-epimerase [Legionella hackeliae]CEK10236.1 Vi polysaccharide biosynthesis protein vipB/tviC [Legionella hackeliae]STX46965.1 UDP-glucuronate 5'-epimerase [Legionella hackeliae]